MRYNKEETRESIKRVITDMCGMVEVTLGPFGRNVLIGGLNMTPKSTKDGVTAMKHWMSIHPDERVISNLIKQVSIQTYEDAGDGTTTSAVLLKSIMEQYWELPEGLNVHELIAGMKKAVEIAKQSILSESIPFSDKVLECVARISSNGDEKIVKLVSEAYKHGSDLSFHVQDNKTGRNEVEKVDGVAYEEGYIDPVFINTGRGTCELENAHVLIYDGKLTDPLELGWLIKHFFVTNHQGQIVERQKGREKDSLVIICEDVQGRVAHWLANAAKDTGLGVCVVKMYQQNALRKDVMADLGIMLGAKYCSSYSGQMMNGLDHTVLGFCKKVVVKRTQTIFMKPNHDTKVVKKRISEINELAQYTNGDFEKSEVEKRVKRMQGKVVTIHVSEKTVAETDDLKDRLDDALRACEATVAMGAGAGGGLVYHRVAFNMNSLDENLGYNLMQAVLSNHFHKIYGKIGAPRNINVPMMAIDYKTGAVKDCLELGLLDSTKVQISALENAVSVASQLMKTERIITL